MLTEVLYNWDEANVRLFHIINGAHTVCWDRFMILGTWLTDNRNVAILVGFGLIIGTIMRRRSDTANDWFRTSVVLGLSYVLTSGSVFGIKHMTKFARPPDLLPWEVVRVIEVPNDPFSFPSGHAALGAMLVTALWPHLSIPWRIAALFFVVWVALSRIVLGVHFPVDVGAGLLMGALVTWLIRMVADSISGRPHS
jgi:undecaprenyl-diphosphatase